MFQSGLSLWPHNSCLVRELANELETLSNDELRQCTIVLPTKRLGTWLLSLLAKKRGAFVPPSIFNLSQFLSSDSDANQSLTDLQQELILAALIEKADEQSFKHIKIGHEHEIQQFFAELTTSGLGIEGFEKLHDVLAKDVYRSDEQLASLHERVRELEALHDSFSKTLAQMKTTTTQIHLANASKNLTKEIDSNTKSYEKLYFVGFTSIASCFKTLFQTLARDNSTAIWISKPPELFSAVNPLHELLEMFEVEASNRKPTCPQKNRWKRVNQTETSLIETAEALALVEKYINKGIPPSQIAILVTDDVVYGKILRTMIERQGIEANLAITTKLSQTIAGSWLQALSDFLDDPDEPSANLQLLTHPLTLSWAEKSASSETLREAVVSEMCMASKYSRKTLAEFIEDKNTSSNVSSLCRMVVDAVKPLSDLASKPPSPLGTWTKTLQELMDKLNILGSFHDGESSEDRSSRETAINFLSSLENLKIVNGYIATRPAFQSLVIDNLNSLDVRSTGDQLSGIQVLSIEEARYIPFSVVVMLGCAEGKFPKSLPADNIIDDYLKVRIGLAGWKHLEAIQDTTFALLGPRVPALELFFSSGKPQAPNVRSRFIERLISSKEAKFRLIETDEALLSSFSSPKYSAAPTREDDHGDYKADRSSMIETLSASAIENLIRCPFKFLLSRLGVDKLELPTEGDAKGEGSWLHAVLEAFFTGMEGKTKLADPLSEIDLGENPKQLLLQRINKLSDDLATDAIKFSPSFLHVKTFSWPKFIDHILKVFDLNIENIGAGLKELRFEKFNKSVGEDKLKITLNGQEIPLKGAVDSIDFTTTTDLITDYKSGGTPTAKEVNSGFSPQLIIYAIALNCLDTTPLGASTSLSRMLAGYWSIRNGKWTSIAVGDEAKEFAVGNRLASKKAADIQATTSRVLELANWRHNKLFIENAPFAPDTSMCTYCAYPTICRSKDPQFADLNESSELNDMISELEKAKEEASNE